MPKQQVSGRGQNVGIQLGAGDDKSEPVAHHLCLGDADPLALIESVNKRREKIGALFLRVFAGHAAVEGASDDAPVALASFPRHAEEEKTQYSIQGAKPTQRNADRAELGVEEVPLDPGVLIHVFQAVCKGLTETEVGDGVESRIAIELCEVNFIIATFTTACLPKDPRYQLGCILLDDGCLRTQGLVGEAVAEHATYPAVCVALSSEERMRTVQRRCLAVWIFEKEWFGRVEVLPCLGESGCEFIGRDADHGPILIM